MTIERCPECGERITRTTWKDPITKREWPGMVKHMPGCTVYLQRKGDRTIAHLQRIDVGRKKTQ